ncbi:O-antigen ligase domain-containing protein [Jiangella aurantiaca]|uniref:O-antigen ligase domain-containing protein n=1 Tax=Jiangella aurantiaca TaxID=2530373 RepID=A0A4R5AHP8_9ACTN|nr:O-antigen ligase family protein [Jiangella aurantiaca]TDD70946.1 O-antigen ligase domain-containing protein [Jiangella aurantiaca]
MTSGAGTDTRTRKRLDAAAWLTLYIALLFFVPAKLIFGPLGSAGSPSMVFGLGSLVLWTFYFVGATKPVQVRVQPIRIALCAFLVSVGVTYVLAMSGPINPDEISPADVALLALASWAGTLLVAHDGVTNRARLDSLVWRIAVCGGLIAMLGVVQVLTNQIWVDRISIPGLTASDTAGTYLRGAFLRPAGTAIHPIEYGVVVTMLLPLALHVGFQHTWRHRIARWFPAAALAAVIPVTSSRSAYLGAIVGVAICAIGWPTARRRVVLGIGAAGVAAMTILTPTLFNSILGLFTGASEDPSIASRTDSFGLAASFIAENPWFGRGLGTFLPKYRIFDNQYLGLLVTVGIVGTTLFVALSVVTIVTLLRLRRGVRNEPTRDLAMALVASVAVGFICLVMFDAFAFPMTMGTLFLLLGISGALRRTEDQGGTMPAVRP